MDRYKVHRIAEFISICRDFPYDSDAVVESLNEILVDYDVYDCLCRDEYYLLMDELLELVEQSEIREAVAWSSRQLVCGHNSGSDYRIPGYV